MFSYERSPFGDPNISLSPIPKAKDDQTPSKGRHLRFNKSPIQFNGTKDFESDSDGDEHTIETKTEKINPVNKVNATYYVIHDVIPSHSMRT